MEKRNSRIGLVLFGIYLVLYGGFVLLNAFSPETMEKTPVAGVNLAILYGFGLIIAALVLALLYGWLCKSGDSEVTERGVNE
jgi:uncharacterized membrane protein (DUF485 family)